MRDARAPRIGDEVRGHSPYPGATSLIPDPNSTELAVHIGHARGGWPGLITAGLSFILPAFVFVALSGVLLPRLRNSSMAGAVLVDPLAVALALALALFRSQVDSARVIGGGVAPGWLRMLLSLR